VEGGFGFGDLEKGKKEKVGSLFDQHERWSSFGRYLSLVIETRAFDEAFGGCWAWIRRLYKKIGCRKFLISTKSLRNLKEVIFLSSLQITTE
jgi:hypothetical protein